MASQPSVLTADNTSNVRNTLLRSVARISYPVHIHHCVHAPAPPGTRTGRLLTTGLADVLTARTPSDVPARSRRRNRTTESSTKTTPAPTHIARFQISRLSTGIAVALRSAIVLNAMLTMNATSPDGSTNPAICRYSGSHAKTAVIVQRTGKTNTLT